MWEVSLISISVCLYLFLVFLFARVFKKSGLGYWGLLSIVPLMLLPLLMILAFAEWPIADKGKHPIQSPKPLYQGSPSPTTPHLDCQSSSLPK
jgi:hypothetical protein